MTRATTWKMVIAIFFLWAVATMAEAQTFEPFIKLVGPKGTNPLDTLIQGIDGNLYGTTYVGGSGVYCCGAVVKIYPSGDLTSLHLNDRDGAKPYAGLVLATDGNFYGTTLQGGEHNGGEIFRVSPKGELTTLYSFCGQSSCPYGTLPYGSLVEGLDGNLYGTTYSGGDGTCHAPSGCGTVFRITLQGALTTLHAFSGADGTAPYAGLVQSLDGSSFYGTTSEGGTGAFCEYPPGCGTAFTITPSGQLTTLYSFCSQPNCVDGQYVLAGLIEATDGDFYGTTEAGGEGSVECSEGCGTIFKITSAGSLTTLHSFNDLTDGAYPDAALVQGTDGNFYGTTVGTSGGGSVFSMNSTGTLVYQYGFSLLGDGANPVGGLLQATSGIFYGTTAAGGNDIGPSCQNNGYDGCGTIYQLFGLRPFVAFVRNPARVGQQFGILGQEFTGTTSVSLNGSETVFTVKSDTFITAVVPSGATTGYVTVTTPTGVLTSNLPFHVIP